MDSISITDSIAAIAALGTAAYGLVDASKAIWGGPSRFGFGYIRKALNPFAGALLFVGGEDFFDTLKANWLNGVPTADQKAKAKSLIHLGLTEKNATDLAKAAGIDSATLLSATQHIDQGQALLPEELSILGRFDAIVSAKIDEGYERADQMYRNSAKILSGAVAVALAIAGQTLVDPQGSYLTAILIGLVSTPLAPIAKDLSSSLSSAVSAIGIVKR